MSTQQETGAPSGLEEQIAVVTGGGRGVGRAIALALARLGASVAVAARSGDEVEQVAATIVADGGKAIPVPTDVTDESAVRSLVERVTAVLGPPTLLVNNAGSWTQVGPLAEADPAAWWHDVEVNLKGTFLCTRAVVPVMIEAGRGRIVNVSSYAAVSPSPFMTAYASAKAAVLRLTDSLAAELDSTGVRVFCVTPGFVRTQLVERAIASEQGRRYLPKLETRPDALEPERVARLVADIATGRLDVLSGRFLHVLDDVDELVARAEEIVEDDLYALRLRTETSGTS